MSVKRGTDIERNAANVSRDWRLSDTSEMKKAGRIFSTGL